MELPAVFERYRGEVARELEAALGSSPLPLYHMLRYHLGWADAMGRPQPGGGGKAVRSTLCLAACEAVGGDSRVALPAAAAIELVHNFSLIHDDIQDASPERRGRPSVWRLWGSAQAITAGDAMHVLGRLALLRLEGRGVPQEKVLRAIRILDETCLALCEGQWRDIDFEARTEVVVADYLEMVGGKSAALIECSLRLGALLGSDDEALVSALARFGRKLGMAFQVRDDELDLWGSDPSEEIQRRKKSLPIVYALERATGEQREELRALYSKVEMGREGVGRVMRILEALDARSYTRGMARRYYEEALSELEASGLAAGAQAELRQIAAFLVERDY
jgi:geranylgeranyl diphosphate synthase type I